MWEMYNLYVYMFVHSSVFVRSIMLGMIIWDWQLAELLKRPVFGVEYDGMGWRDTHRASLLIGILLLGSSACLIVVIFLTHILPGVLVYYPLFLLCSGFIVKIRQLLTEAGVDPESRTGRGVVMAANSFVAVVAFQLITTSMIRVYVGTMSRHGYLRPISDDIESRSLTTWYECHLKQGLAAFYDQDFLNLFLR
eukprot:TRINITY_DN17856_c0_g5_i2.p1 TRINITY_DN17856_c0_g5~~TRINITY_DN17856_c0_g5_i2.p1  ORF type:complete len:194 (+),score=8.86 TRINITY_DN17856_c0_g5_i2:130-711(+)